MELSDKKLLLYSLVLPPIFMIAVIAWYKSNEKSKAPNAYLNQKSEVKLTQGASRLPAREAAKTAARDKAHQADLLKEAFSH